MRVVYRGRGCEITEDGGVYRISWEQGAFGGTAEYEISGQNAEKAMRSDRDAYEVKVFAETGKWPPDEEEQREIARGFIRKVPGLLQKSPEARKLFSREEPDELLKKQAKGG